MKSAHYGLGALQPPPKPATFDSVDRWTYFDVHLCIDLEEASSVGEVDTCNLGAMILRPM